MIVTDLEGEAIGYYVDKKWYNVANVIEGGRSNKTPAADVIEARGEAKGRLSKGAELVEIMIKKIHNSKKEASQTANISVDDYKKYTANK